MQNDLSALPVLLPPGSRSTALSIGSDQTMGAMGEAIRRQGLSCGRVARALEPQGHSGQDQLGPSDSMLSLFAARIHSPLGLFAGTWGLTLAAPSKTGWWPHYKRVVFPLVDK